MPLELFFSLENKTLHIFLSGIFLFQKFETIDIEIHQCINLD